MKIIRDCLKAASNRQKSYVDLKRKEIEFQVGDNVFLKVSQWKKILRFGCKGKLNPRFIGPYEVIERIGPVAYRLALLIELERVYNLRNKSIALVKVLWQRHGVVEATWEHEEATRKQYPNLFFGKIFGDENS
ncbi:reverse transcriptase [Gossypium australe]|uniref:Reverse transcriptase n=1 Tax=Gossypium australe TaxID=47621 RepID=A0A5B6U3E8_9ROSI|nr:reverse transcriptase [Gossypium australe]